MNNRQRKKIEAEQHNKDYQAKKLLAQDKINNPHKYRPKPPSRKTLEMMAVMEGLIASTNKY